MNGKVKRMLSAIAVELMDLPDDRLKRLENIIRDDAAGDGYDFDFMGAVESSRVLCRNAYTPKTLINLINKNIV